MIRSTHILNFLFYLFCLLSSIQFCYLNMQIPSWRSPSLPNKRSTKSLSNRLSSNTSTLIILLSISSLLSSSPLLFYPSSFLLSLIFSFLSFSLLFSSLLFFQQLIRRTLLETFSMKRPVIKQVDVTIKALVTRVLSGGLQADHVSMIVTTPQLQFIPQEFLSTLTIQIFPKQRKWIVFNNSTVAGSTLPSFILPPK